MSLDLQSPNSRDMLSGTFMTLTTSYWGHKWVCILYISSKIHLGTRCWFSFLMASLISLSERLGGLPTLTLLLREKAEAISSSPWRLQWLSSHSLPQVNWRKKGEVKNWVVACKTNTNLTAFFVSLRKIFLLKFRDPFFKMWDSKCFLDLSSGLKSLIRRQ